MSVGNQSVIAHMAHVGGALTGFLYIVLDRKNNFNVDRIFSLFRKNKSSSHDNPYSFRRPVKPLWNKKDIEEASYYDINDTHHKDKEDIDQETIDKILDKISRGGYQSLTDKEKKILFEASKRK